MENIIIRNEKMVVEISPKGAELQSITKNEVEYLWQGDGAIWSGRAPVLFPIVGGLKGDAYTYGGKMYSLPKHGFARGSMFEVKEAGKAKAVFVLKSDENTLEQYPFDFELYIEYSLNNNIIEVKYSVLNKTDGEMLFSIGAHEGYSCPVDDDIKFSDYYIEFEKDENLERLFLNESGLINNKSEKFLKDSNIFNLTHKYFDDDAVILEGLQSTYMALRNNKSARTVKVSFAGFPYMGIWQKPGAPYICIEPWYGIADSVDETGNLAEKKGIIKLNVGEKFECVHTIEID